MKTLVMGASGATGKHLVEQLLGSGQEVKAIVRTPEKLPQSWKENKQLTIVKANISDMTTEEMTAHLADCDAVASCLGHNLTFKGLFGKPRKLVTDAVKLACNSVKQNNTKKPVKFVLMNTTGNRNRDLNEQVSFGHKVVVGLLRFLLPPHSDNETASDYLRTEIGQKDNHIEWVAVRPDGLTSDTNVSDYELHQSPIRDAIFDAGKTSRINVANFMARLVIEQELWDQWKGQMPVIYNSEIIT